jgi:hypothetical protein
VDKYIIILVIVLLAAWLIVWNRYARKKEKLQENTYYLLLSMFKHSYTFHDWTWTYRDMTRFLNRCDHRLREVWRVELLKAANDSWISMSVSVSAPDKHITISSIVKDEQKNID